MSEKALSECPFYQSILTTMQRLDKVVTMNVDVFDREWLRKVDDDLDAICTAVEEGGI